MDRTPNKLMLTPLDTPTPVANEFQGSPWTDWMGIVASVACAIHCAAMPFVIAFLPALGLSFLVDEGFHQVMVFVCLAFAAVSFVPGWRRHRRLMPVGIATLGLLMIASAAFAFEGQCCSDCETLAATPATEAEVSTGDDACCPHCVVDSDATTLRAEQVVAEPPAVNTASLAAPLMPWITPLGGLLLVSAHLANRRFICRCGCCPAPSQE